MNVRITKADRKVVEGRLIVDHPSGVQLDVGQGKTAVIRHADIARMVEVR